MWRALAAQCGNRFFVNSLKGIFVAAEEIVWSLRARTPQQRCPAVGKFACNAQL